MNEFRHPTTEEIRALERAARRARSEEIARLARAAVEAMKRVMARRRSRTIPVHGS